MMERQRVGSDAGRGSSNRRAHGVIRLPLALVAFGLAVALTGHSTALAIPLIEDAPGAATPALLVRLTGSALSSLLQEGLAMLAVIISTMGTVVGAVSRSLYGLRTCATVAHWALASQLSLAAVVTGALVAVLTQRCR